MKKILLLSMSALLTPCLSNAATANVAGDTYISSGSVAQNFGSLGTLNVGGGSRALIQFDLTNLPPGVTAGDIQRATLTLFINKVLVAGGLDASQVTSSWSESTVTFSTAPTVGAPFFSNVPVMQSGSFVTVDITSLVQTWISGTPNFGIQIAAALGSPSTVVIVDSKESISTSRPAFLDITLNSGGGTGPAGATGATGPLGPMGATGATGPAGPAGGPSGATGPSGPLGPAGVAGPSGPSGPLGAAGAAGPSGPLGPAGVAGPSGPSGPLGAAGAAGPSGPLGPAGVAGPSGPSGPLGSAGVAGPSGPLGPAGAAGPSGPSGPFGPAGVAGPSGPSGPVGPAGSNGTGSSPTGIPLGTAGHTGAAAWNDPAGPSQQVSLSALASVIAPTACKPSMSIVSFSGVSTTWTLFSVNPSTASSTWTANTTVISCSTASGGGSTCSATAGGNVAAGTIMTLTSGTSASGAAPGGGGFLSSFSCQ